MCKRKRRCKVETVMQRKNGTLILHALLELGATLKRHEIPALKTENNSGSIRRHKYSKKRKHNQMLMQPQQSRQGGQPLATHVFYHACHNNTFHLLNTRQQILQNAKSNTHFFTDKVTSRGRRRQTKATDNSVRLGTLLSLVIPLVTIYKPGNRMQRSVTAPGGSAF